MQDVNIIEIDKSEDFDYWISPDFIKLSEVDKHKVIFQVANLLSDLKELV